MAGSINLPEGPDPVLNAATTIGDRGLDFRNKYLELYSLVENELADNWQGSDYDSFKSKMEEEKIHFESMYDVILEYSSTLRNAINAHVAREEDSKNQVSQSASFDN